MKRVRIGNGCGFWGDNLDAPIELARDGRLDYLTLEYLAELTMSILALQKQKKPEAGFASDFLDVLGRLAPILKQQPGLKVITNAGGMNPAGCAAKARALLDQNGLADRRIGVVSGDDLLPRLDALQPLVNLDTGADFATVKDRVVSANAYLGAQPIAEALGQGASIVITGRVADASLTVGPTVFELGWPWDDWDRLSAATVAGHLIECGAQCTGGLWCNWQETDLARVGYPIADLDEAGNCLITKPAGTGGRVNVETVSEQLLYEVGDPAAYLTPDVVADFTSLTLREVREDEVEMTGAKGKPATDTYKASIAYRDGWASSGTLVVFGPAAIAKARSCGAMLLERLKRAGVTPEHSLVEVIGGGDGVPGVLESGQDPPEVTLRVAVRDSRREMVERFTKEFAPLVTSGPPGITGYATGRPVVREVFAYWPALVKKSLVPSNVTIV
ncbi:MAG: acyclic terpene utilization AtuA family protein [Gemmataceae bacterium]